MVGAFVAILLAAGYAVAQEPRGDQEKRQPPKTEREQPEREREQLKREQTDRPESQQRSGESQASQLDQYLAKLVLCKNEAEIQIAQMGQEQAENPQVKEFATRMVEEHRQLSQKLQQIAGQGTAPLARRSATPSPDRKTDSPQPSKQADSPEKKAPPKDADALAQPKEQKGEERIRRGFRSRPGESRALAGAEADQLVQILEEVSLKQVGTIQKGLEDKQGEEFDRTFMGLQLLGHMAMVDMLEVTKEHASGELQQTLEEAHKTTKQHLQEAEDVHQQVKSSTRGSTRAEPERRRTPTDQPKRSPRGADDPRKSPQPRDN